MYFWFLPNEIYFSLGRNCFFSRMQEILAFPDLDYLQGYFEPFLQEGKDILHLTLSSGISGVYNSAKLAAEELLEQYPERRIVVMDSLAASSGYGLLMDRAADLRDEGRFLEEVRDWLEENRLKLHHWFFSTDLT